MRFEGRLASASARWSQAQTAPRFHRSKVGDTGYDAEIV